MSSASGISFAQFYSDFMEETNLAAAGEVNDTIVASFLE